MVEWTNNYYKSKNGMMNERSLLGRKPSESRPMHTKHNTLSRDTHATHNDDLGKTSSTGLRTHATKQSTIVILHTLPCWQPTEEAAAAAAAPVAGGLSAGAIAPAT